MGRHVVKALVERGYSVRALARKPGHEEVVNFDKVEVRYADVFDPDAMGGVMNGVDVVVHLVAIIKERKGATFSNVNYLGTANVVTAARWAGVERFVHMGAIGSQNNPRFPYLQSKWLGEHAVVSSNVPYTVLRGSLLFGPGDEFISTLAGVVKAFPVVPMAGNGRARFQPIHVEDVARCIVQAIEQGGLRNQTLEIGGPEVLTYNEIIDAITLTYFLRRLKLHVPIPIMRILVWFMEKLLPNPPITMHQLNMLALDNVAELGTVEEVFGFAPRPLQGNIEYIKDISYSDALRISMGFMPKHIRDH